MLAPLDVRPKPAKRRALEVVGEGEQTDEAEHHAPAIV